MNLSRHALYAQVYEALVQRVVSGAWKPGDCLPNEIELAREFGVSPGTMRKALDKLETDRLVVRRQGRGTFVLDHASKALATRYNNLMDERGELLAPSGSTLLSQDIGTPVGAECDRLGIRASEKMLRTRRVRCRQGRPYMYEEAAIAAGRLPGLEHDGAAAAGDYLIVPLAQRYGRHLGRAAEKVGSTPASPEVAGLLGVRLDTPLLQLDRIIFTIDEQPLEWRIALCHLKDEYYFAQTT